MKFQKLLLWNQIAIMQSLKDILKSLKELGLPDGQETSNLQDRSWLTNRINDTMNFMKEAGDANEEIHTSRKDEQKSST